MINYAISIKRLSDRNWQWIVRQHKEIIASGQSAGESFAFCSAVKAIMNLKGYHDEIGTLR